MQTMTASHLLMEWNLLKNVENLPESPAKGMESYSITWSCSLNASAF